jgi:hypothetical protein
MTVLIGIQYLHDERVIPVLGVIEVSGKRGDDPARLE